jgi:hypothetical protein
MKILFSLALVTSSVAIQGATQVTPAQQPAYIVTVAASPTVVKAGSDVKLTITIKNVSDLTIYHIVNSGKPGRNWQILVLDSQGNSANETSNGRKIHGNDPSQHPWSGSVFSGRYPIKPGETFQQTLDLTSEYDLTKPGIYSIQVLRSDVFTEDDIKTGKLGTAVKSNTITLTLTP